MSADELRAAASKLRELAQRATPGPWRLALGGPWGAAIWLPDTLASRHRNRLREKKK